MEWPPEPPALRSQLPAHQAKSRKYLGEFRPIPLDTSNNRNRDAVGAHASRSDRLGRAAQILLLGAPPSMEVCRHSNPGLSVKKAGGPGPRLLCAAPRKTCADMRGYPPLAAAVEGYADFPRCRLRGHIDAERPARALSCSKGLDELRKATACSSLAGLGRRTLQGLPEPLK